MRYWQEALRHLHEADWGADDIDAACDALHEACTEGALAGTPLPTLTRGQVRQVLAVNVPDRDAHALVQLAEARSQQGPDAEALRRALYDLDGFFRELDDED